MEMREELKKRTGEVESIVDSSLPAEEGYQKTIFDAMIYSVRAGGKRLRPMLMEETYHLFGGTEKAVEPFMAAMEMIHTSSLIHDDLPCMDNDELRRGLPTTWKKFGYDMAVLAGDALMIYAFETASRAFAMTRYPDRAARSIQVLAEKTGIYGMIGGQVVDVQLTGKPVPQEKLDFIYRLKTGALLEASMMIGAILGGASADEVKCVEEIASAVGLAFQIQDDILDVTSTSEALGKPVLSDEKNQKTTYVTLVGLEQAKKNVEEISARAVSLLKELPGNNAFLENLIAMLVERKK